MADITALQEAVLALPEADYVRFRQWFSELDWERWDQRIEANSEKGKLDSLIAKAREAKEKGTLRELRMHRTTPQFWERFKWLPESVQRVAKRNFRLLNENPRHSSLHFKKVGKGPVCR